MSDLTRWLHEFADACEIVAAGRWPGPRTAARLREVAAALEAAREDAEDAAKYRWALNNSCWIRGEHAAYVAIPVARNADLSCVAMRDAAIDQARGKGGCGEGVAP